MGHGKQHRTAELRDDPGREEQQSHTGRGARDREQPPELAVEEGRRERTGDLGVEPDRRVDEEDDEAGRSPEESVPPGRAAAPCEHRDEEESESDRGRDVRDGGPQSAFDAVARRPGVAVAVAVAGAGRGGIGRCAVPVRSRLGVAAEQGVAVVLVRKAPGGMGVSGVAVAVREKRGVSTRGLVGLRRKDERGDRPRLERGERDTRHDPRDDAREEDPLEHHRITGSPEPQGPDPGQWQGEGERVPGVVRRVVPGLARGEAGRKDDHEAENGGGEGRELEVRAGPRGGGFPLGGRGWRWSCRGLLLEPGHGRPRRRNPSARTRFAPAGPHHPP